MVLLEFYGFILCFQSFVFRLFPRLHTLCCDNLDATYLSVNPVSHARTKHVEVNYHFVRDIVIKREIRVRFISFKYQLAYVLTKSLDI